MSVQARLGSSLVLRVDAPGSAASMLVEVVHSGVDFPHMRVAAAPELEEMLNTFAFRTIRTPVDLVEHAVPLVASMLVARAEGG